MKKIEKLIPKCKGKLVDGTGKILDATEFLIVNERHRKNSINRKSYPKEVITSEFNKLKIEAIKTLKRNETNLDPIIKNFLKRINKKTGICTLFSCQGHCHEGRAGQPYLFFTVNKRGWNIFWNDVLPELSFFLNEYNTNYQLVIETCYNVYNSGITLRYQMNVTYSEDVELKKLEDKMVWFWGVLEYCFFKYFKT